SCCQFRPCQSPSSFSRSCFNRRNHGNEQMRIEWSAGVDHVDSTVARVFVSCERRIGRGFDCDVTSLYAYSQSLACEKPSRRRPNLDLDRHALTWSEPLLAQMGMKRLFRRGASRVQLPMAHSQPTQSGRPIFVQRIKHERDDLPVAVEFLYGHEQ